MRVRLAAFRCGFEWLVEAGLLLALPLIFSRGFTEQFTYPKAFLLQVLAIAAAAFTVLGAAWGFYSIPRGWGRLIPLALLGACVLVSCKNSSSPLFSLHECTYFLCGLAWTTVLVFWGPEASRAPRLAALVAAAGAAVAVVTLLQWSGHDPLLFGGYQIDWGKMVARMRLYGTMGNPNFTAGYLAGAVFPAVALGMIARTMWQRAMWLTVAGIMLVATWGTGSRGAYLGVLAGACVFAGIWVLGSRPDRSRGKRRAAPARAITARSLLPPACLFFIPGMLDFLGNVLGRLAGRIYIWQFSWPMFADHPWLGGGWGVYQLRFLDLQANFLADHPDMVHYWSNVRLLHNDALQLLLETGVAGLVGLLAVLAAFVVDTHAAASNAQDRRRLLLTAAAAAGFTAMGIDSFFNYQIEVPAAFILMCTYLAIPAILRAASPEDERARMVHPESQEHPTRSLRFWVVRSVVTLVALGAAAWLIWVRAQFARAEWDYRAAVQAEDSGRLTQAEELARRGLQRNRLNGRLHFALSRLCYQSGRLQEAVTEAEQATLTYSDSHVFVVRGHALEALGRDQEALDTFRYAVALDPTLESPQAQIEILEKKLGQSEGEP